MDDPSDKARGMAALQLAQWMFLHLVRKGVISQGETKRILERAIELNIRNDQDHGQVASAHRADGSSACTRPRPLTMKIKDISGLPSAKYHGTKSFSGGI